MALEITDQNFNEVVLQSDKPVLVDFWAPWCGPCRMIAPIVDELAAQYEGSAVVAKCDVDQCSEIPAQYGIRNIPTILIFNNGEVKHKIVGATTKDVLVAKISELLD